MYPSGGMIPLNIDVDSDLDGGYDALESDLADNLEILDMDHGQGQSWGHNRMPPKKYFKEDDENFLDGHRFSEDENSKVERRRNKMAR